MAWLTWVGFLCSAAAFVLRQSRTSGPAQVLAFPSNVPHVEANLSRDRVSIVLMTIKQTNIIKNPQSFIITG